MTRLTEDQLSDPKGDLNVLSPVYFQNSRADVALISLNPEGSMLLVELPHQQTGSHSELEVRYRRMMTEAKNRDVLDQVEKKLAKKK